MKVLMCCSTLKTKGGMVSVVKNYLGYNDWNQVSIKYVPTHFDTNRLLLLLYFSIQFVRIWYLVITRHFDIAHLHVAERGSFWRKRFLLYFFHRHGIKVVLHHHGAEFEDFYSTCSEKQQNRIRQTLEDADVNIVLSSRLISMIRDKAPKANVRVLYNAVETYPSNLYKNDSRNILFLGRLGQRKGTFDLLDVIKILDSQIPSDIKFYLCGDMGEDVVREKIDKLGIEHRIAHVGWINTIQRREFFKNTMINCLPSYHEGLPMSILETMSAGIPNISTNIASIPEVLKDGENGFLITPGDKDALCDRLLKLINSPELRDKFSRKSYDLINEKFSLTSHIVVLQGIYEELMA